ncbi:MAG: hypothetical protein GPJ25_18590 [Microcystis aeruginosa LE13-04]|nr:hypothetical protein [Microcystis aeruginosa LE13-04]
MTLGTFLQAIISIVFIYLILALLTSELQEYLATISEARAKRLKQSIRQMLGEDGLKYTDPEGFQVFSPPSWESQYSLQDEKLTIDKKGLQKHQGQEINKIGKSWIEGLVISEIKDDQNIISDGDKEVIWTNKNQELSVTEVIEDSNTSQQGFVKNLTRFPVYTNVVEIALVSSAWLKGRILTPVVDSAKIFNENGNKFIWIDTTNQQELPDNAVNTKTVEKCPVYTPSAAIPSESKMWIQKSDVRLIDTADRGKIFKETGAEFIWVDTKIKIIDSSSVKIDPNDPESGSDKSILAKKSPVYQLVMPLAPGSRFYIDDQKREIKSPLKVNSLTEKLYQHPQIVALNQTAFRWLSFLGISFMYPSPLKLKKWNGEDMFSLGSTVILILLIISLWLGLGFPFLQIVLVIFFVIVGVFNFRHSQKIRRKSGNTRNSQGPGYIDDADLFVDTLIDILKKESDAGFQPNDKDGVKKTLETLTFYTPAQSLLIDRVNLSSNINDVDTFKQDIKKLYEEVQKRSTGVYKRNAKGLSFLVGLLIAVVANADTFNMMTHLTKANNEFSQNLIAELEKNPQIFNCPKENPKCLNEASRQTQLKQLINNSGTLPLGWSFSELLALEHKKELLEQNKAALEQNKSELDQQIKKIEGEREAKKLAITNNQELVTFLASNESLCKEQEKECLNQVVTALSKDPNRSKLISLIDQDFKNTLKQSFDNPADFSKKYKDFLTKKREETKELEQALLLFDFEKEDILIDLRKQLNDDQEIQKVNQEIQKVTSASSWDNIDRNVKIQGGWPRVLFGWLITAIALSMGAPFWFDLLGRIMNVRNAAKSPDSTTSNQPDSTTSNP